MSSLRFLYRRREDLESLSPRGLGEAVVEGDEGQQIRPLRAGDEGGARLRRPWRVTIPLRGPGPRAGILVS